MLARHSRKEEAQAGAGAESGRVVAASDFEASEVEVLEMGYCL